MSANENEKEQAPAASTAPKSERGFIEGEHVVLRPVLEADFGELAPLLAANPYAEKQLPWTQQRLKQRYEDKDEPGLWGKRERYYVIVRKTGGVAGFLMQNGEDRDSSWCRMYVDEAAADRDVLGREALSGYLAYMRRWKDPGRITFDVLSLEEEAISWLEATGFEHEVTIERAALYRGRPETLKVYAWLSERVKANLADDGPVAGEEV